MLGTLSGVVLDREGLTLGLANLDRHNLRQFNWHDLASATIPARGGLIGRWRDSAGDPLPEFLLVRDDDHADVLAWLGSYFAGLSPITQWCRILSVSQAEQLAKTQQQITLEHRLGAWVGAILAECSVQSDGAANLRELPGSAALSTATFAAGRAAAISSDWDGFTELARRHDELSLRLRDASRPVSAEALLPLWHSLSRGGPSRLPVSDRRALEPFKAALESAFGMPDQTDIADLIQKAATDATVHFNVPEISECARGPQVDRLRALDRLATRLIEGPRAPAIEALLGLAASFVEPGTAVLPDLLRKYSTRYPLAPIWLGAFAGAWAPARVISGQQGLGRLIAKSLLALTDLETRPNADVAYEELSRWLSPGRGSQRLDLRGMSARSLAVEILPGVTCAFAYGRTEPSVTAAFNARTEARGDLRRGAAIPATVRQPEARTLESLWDLVGSLAQRVDRIERRGSETQSQLDLPEPQDSKPKRGKPGSFNRS